MTLTRRTFLASACAAAALPTRAGARPVYPAQRIAPLIMVGFDGAGPMAYGARQMAAHVAAGHVGGLCFVAKNAVSRPGVEGLTRLFHSAASRWPLLVGIDQEGGMVQRLSSHLGYGFEPSAQQIAANADTVSAHKTFSHMAGAMRASGFNLNLAPVVDLSCQPRNPAVAMIGRAYGADPQTVISYAGEFVAAHREQGVLTALKHFPGHGSSLSDSHLGAVDVTKTWHARELEPYSRLVGEDSADMVMSGHVSHALITEGQPASLSRVAIEGVLRGRVGFRGPVITDDLEMAALHRTLSPAEAAIRALDAGNDILLLTNFTADPHLPLKLIIAIQGAIEEGRLETDRLEASVARVEVLKASLKQPHASQIA